MSERIEQIKQMLAESGEDVFLRYSLGMEYVSSQQWEDAVTQFEVVIQADEQYLAAYVEAGKALRAAGRQADARDMLAQALELAGQKGETHVEDYIRQLLNAF